MADIGRTAPRAGLSDQIELHHGHLGHHVLVPGGIPDQIDPAVPDDVQGGNLALHFGGSEPATGHMGEVRVMSTDPFS